ncbi:MAG TPA: DUF2325 domain-containing protein [Rhizobacter sp.]|nr:DUF2325 domain-containing protein [Rhizobacter sp.]
MCQKDPDQLETLVRLAAAETGVTVLNPPAPATGSRRRRLWELDSHAHCPIVGVCLPIAALRRLVDKVLAGQAVADDYELHCGVIAECRLRTPIAEAVQRELDRRCMLPLRQAAKAKTTEALAAWWHGASQGKDLAGAFWATLTHARCTPALAHQVLGEVHMLQHQVGMARRVDLEHFENLIDENAVLARELGAAQQRCTRQADEHRLRIDQQQVQIVQLRAQLIGRDTAIATLREDLQTLEAAAPGLKSRYELARESEHYMERIHQLERALLQAQQEAERQRRRTEELANELQRRDGPADDAQATDTGPATRLDDRAVLCVGGRPASVPVYRQLIERTGGRFLHHDGGEEDSPAKLDSTLAAADLVICQTGCISHDVYWRVKDHCKRTGKRCVFVESPSTAGLKRALLALVPAAPPTDASVP